MSRTKWGSLHIHDCFFAAPRDWKSSFICTARRHCGACVIPTSGSLILDLSVLMGSIALCIMDKFCHYSARLRCQSIMNEIMNIVEYPSVSIVSSSKYLERPSIRLQGKVLILRHHAVGFLFSKHCDLEKVWRLLNAPDCPNCPLGMLPKDVCGMLLRLRTCGTHH